MKKKIDILRELMNAGDWKNAIALASKFPRLGDAGAAIKTAQGAWSNPRFYTQLGKDINQLKADGQAALIKRFSTIFS